MFSLFSKSPPITEPCLELPDEIAPEESSGIFDPVPANATIGVCGKPVQTAPAHDLETRIQRRLLNEPGLNFRSLTVRRLGNGAVCIEGVLTGSSIAPNIDDLVQEVDGVQRVVNHVLVCQGDCV